MEVVFSKLFAVAFCLLLEVASKFVESSEVGELKSNDSRDLEEN